MKNKICILLPACLIILTFKVNRHSVDPHIIACMNRDFWYFQDNAPATVMKLPGADSNFESPDFDAAGASPRLYITAVHY